MNILFTICGRAGSKGVKNKNIKDFLGVPLVYYSLAAIKLCTDSMDKESLYRIVLNTDSNELVEIVNRQTLLPIDILWRDESLGGDSVPKVAVIKDCYNRSKNQSGIDYDAVLDLDITSPLRTANDVENVILKKINNPKSDVVYTVTNSRRNPYFNMVKENNGFFEKAIHSEYTSRQQAPIFYDMNASLYAYSPDALINKDEKTFFNDGAMAVLMKDTAVLDIDSEEDYEMIQVIGKYLFEKYPCYNEVREMAIKIKESYNK